MSLLGGIGSALGGLFKSTPGGMSASDKLTLIGSALSDFGNGGSPEMTMQARKMISGNAEERQKQAAMAQFLGLLNGQNAAQMIPGKAMQGPGSDGEPLAASLPPPAPIATQVRTPGLTIGDPRLIPALGAVMQGGASPAQLAPLLDVMKAQQPDVGFSPTGMGYNKHDGGMVGKFQPTLDKSQEPLFDARGNIVGVRNMDGSVQSAAEMAGAVEGAKAAAQAPFQFTTIQGPNGEPITGANSALAGRVFQGQTPGAKVTQEGLARVGVDQVGDRSKAATAASLALPQATAQAQQTIGIIDSLLANPEMKHRTGLMSVLPAMPGSSGAGFDAMHDQLTGQVFMQAYSTLKGGGQITEVEGKKATAALARLSRAQKPEDYAAGLRDLRQVIAKGLERAQMQAGQGAAPSRPSQGGGAWTPDQARAELARRRASSGQ